MGEITDAAPGSPVDARLSDFVDRLPSAVYLVDTDWRFSYVNETAARNLSKRARDVIGSSVWDVVATLDDTAFAGALRRTMDERHVTTTKAFSIRRSQWFESVAYPNGEGIAVQLTDITEEQHARDRLRSQAALLDAARDAIFVRDLDHVITYWNEGAERLYGWRADEAVGRTSRELIYPDPTLFDTAQEEVMRHGHWAGELQHHTRDGRALVADCRWQVLTDDAGEPTAVMCVNSDISDLKREQARLYREQRLESLGTLAGGIAHDLNNVFTPILITAQLLADEEGDVERRELLGSIESSVGRGADMIRQVLTFARGEDVHRSLIDMRVLIEQLHAFARGTLPMSIELEVDAADDLQRVTGDSTQILQVLMNLVTNARDAMPAGGALLIHARNLLTEPDDADSVEQEWVVVEVEDSGTGMDARTLDKVFEPFFTTKAIGTGTGLGLSTSLAIARAHGGDIDVYSELGRGTRFRVRFPVAADGAEATAARVVRPTAEDLRGSGERVLIVDDESIIRGILQQTLEKNGYQTVLAGNGHEAVDVLLGHPHAPIDLVVTDMMMPGMDGAATAAFLHTNYPAIPVIAVSGLSTNHAPARAANPDLRHFLVKPFSTSELLTAVRGALAG